MTQRKPLDRQAVIVAGSTHGIGLAVALALAAHGAAVVVNGRLPDAVKSAVDSVRLAGGRAVGVAGSAADHTVVHALVGAATGEFGGVDALVNCAGTPEPVGSSILDISADDWRGLMDSHLETTFQTCRAVAPLLVEHGGGAIVNTSSHAFTGTFGGTGYPAAKGAIISLTYALAAELAEHGVSVNAVCPGARTRLSSGSDYNAHIEMLHTRGLLDDATYAGSLDPGQPEHVAPLYAFLCSDRAADITGEVFAGSGGYLGRFERPTAQLLAWRDHHEHPPWTLDEVAHHLFNSEEPADG